MSNPPPPSPVNKQSMSRATTAGVILSIVAIVLFVVFWLVLGQAGLEHIPVVVGGIIPPEDAKALEAMGVERVYTPKDYALNGIVGDIVDLVHRRLNRLAGQGSATGESKRA